MPFRTISSLASSLVLLAVAGCSGGKNSSSGSEDQESPDQGATCSTSLACDDHAPGTTPQIPKVGDAGGDTRSISGSVGTLAIGSGSDFVVEAFAISTAGERMESLGQAMVGADGKFELNVVPPGTLAIGLELGATGLSLTSGPSPKMRSYVEPMTGDVEVGINLVSEAVFSRLDAIKAANAAKPFGSALAQARAETTALVGVASVFTRPTALTTAGNADSTKLGLYLQGIDLWRDRSGLDDEQLLGKVLDDFSDGSLDSRNADGESIKIGDFPMFRNGYAGEMRESMKSAIRTTDDVKIDYNNIPNVSDTPATLIAGLQEDEIANYTPNASSYFERWIEITFNGEPVSSIDFDLSAAGGVSQCFGPFRLRKVNNFGRPLANDTFVEFTLSGMSGQGSEEFFTDSSCTNAVTDDQVPLQLGDSQTQEFWVNPNTIVSPGFRALAIGYNEQKYDYAHLYMNREYNGSSVSSVLSFVIIDDLTKFPLGNFQMLGDSESPIARDTCYAAAAYLEGGVAPFNISVTALQNNALNKPVGAEKQLGIFSDDTCQSATTSINIAAGDRAGVFYVSLPATYARTFGWASEFALFGVVTPTMITLTSNYQRFYGVID